MGSPWESSHMRGSPNRRADPQGGWPMNPKALVVTVGFTTLLAAGLPMAANGVDGTRQGQAFGTTEDLCAEIFSAARRGDSDPLPEYGLTGIDLPSEIAQAFTPASLTCLSGSEGDDSFVRGIFVEYRDSTGFVAAYISPSRTVRTDWGQYFGEIMPGRSLEMRSDRGGWLIIDVDGPAADVADSNERRRVWSEAVAAVQGEGDPR
jgi:hypothetical protein